MERRLMRLEDVETGFRYLEEIGKLFGEDCTFYTGMIEGINEKMNMDLLTYLKDPVTREVMYAEALIQGIMEGRTVDMDEILAEASKKAHIEPSVLRHHFESVMNEMISGVLEDGRRRRFGDYFTLRLDSSQVEQW